MTKEKWINLDEKDGNKLQGCFRADGETEFLITSPGDDPDLKIEAKGHRALDDILVHWKRIHSKAHSKWRNTHFDGIIAKANEIQERVDDKQEALPMGDDE